MQQVFLNRYNQFQMVWVDRESEIKKGSIVSLKGESEKWKIVDIYHPQINKKEINRDWKVGGL